MSFAYWTRSCLSSSDNARGTKRDATFLLPNFLLRLDESSPCWHQTHQPSFSQSHNVVLVFVFSLSQWVPRYEQKMDTQAWLHIQSFPHHFGIVHTTWISLHEINNYPVHLSHQFHNLICSFPEFQTKFNVRSMLHAATLNTSSHSHCTTWRRISRHAQRGALRCCQIRDEGWSRGWHALLHR